MLEAAVAAGALGVAPCPGPLLVLLGYPQATQAQKKGLCVQSKVLAELCSSAESPAGLVCPSTSPCCAVSHHASTVCLKRGTPLLGRKSEQEEWCSESPLVVLYRIHRHGLYCKVAPLYWTHVQRFGLIIQNTFLNYIAYAQTFLGGIYSCIYGSVFCLLSLTYL